jgi:hypothetical protein
VSIPPPARFPDTALDVRAEHVVCRPCRQAVERSVSAWLRAVVSQSVQAGSIHDYVQQFYTDELARAKRLGREPFGTFDASRFPDGNLANGFRAFLSQAAKNFCRGNAQKRPSVTARAPALEDVPEPPHLATALVEYQREWARGVVVETFALFRARWTGRLGERHRARREHWFDCLAPYLTDLDPDYVEITAELRCKRGTARRRLYNLREAWRAMARGCVADTLDFSGIHGRRRRDQLIDGEIEELLSWLKTDSAVAWWEMAITPPVLRELATPVSARHHELTLRRMRRRSAKKGRLKELELFEPFLCGEEPDYEHLSRRLCCEVDGVCARLRRVRQVYRRELWRTLEQDPDLAAR